jgi:hypothetical protein
LGVTISIITLLNRNTTEDSGKRRLVWNPLLNHQPWCLWQYLVVKKQRFELTSQRLRAYRGVLSKKTDELELYRVKDTKFDQPFFLRLLGLGNAIIVSFDSTTKSTSSPLNIEGVDLGLSSDDIVDLVRECRDRSYF